MTDTKTRTPRKRVGPLAPAAPVFAEPAGPEERATPADWRAANPALEPGELELTELVGNVEPVAPGLVIIIPTRGRPESIGRTVDAWHGTDAFEVAGIRWALNESDPAFPSYLAELDKLRLQGLDWPSVGALPYPDMRMVPRLNRAATDLLEREPAIRALGFQGDDHLPRTTGWAHDYLATLDEMTDTLGAGMVHSDDGAHGRKLCTEWAVTRSWVETLGRMVPALVSHLYCDDAVHDLAKAAGVYAYLGSGGVGLDGSPDGHTIEHMHPLHGKGQRDDTYARGGLDSATKSADQQIYLKWSMRPPTVAKTGLSRQAAALRALRPAVEPDGSDD